MALCQTLTGICSFAATELLAECVLVGWFWSVFGVDRGYRDEGDEGTLSDGFIEPELSQHSKVSAVSFLRLIHTYIHLHSYCVFT